MLTVAPCKFKRLVGDLKGLSLPPEAVMTPSTVYLQDVSTTKQILYVSLLSACLMRYVHLVGTTLNPMRIPIPFT